MAVADGNVAICTEQDQTCSASRNLILRRAHISVVGNGMEHTMIG
jgi:hypothetical protein